MSISQFVPWFALCRSIPHISTCLLQCRRMSEMEFYGNAWEGADFKRLVRREEGACCFDLEKGRSTWTPSLRNIQSAPAPVQIPRLEYFRANVHRQQLFGRQWKYCLSNIGFFFYFSYSLSDSKAGVVRCCPLTQKTAVTATGFYFCSHPPPPPPPPANALGTPANLEWFICDSKLGS
jgi:hypothetical protein